MSPLSDPARQAPPAKTGRESLGCAGGGILPQKRLLFSVTAKDFDVQTFCTSGNGGQHRNAKQNGVRIIHRASGARAEHRDGRDQGKNRKAAFEKLIETKEWKIWHKMEVSRRLGAVANAEKATEAAMAPSFLKIEHKDENGLWCSCENHLE